MLLNSELLVLILFFRLCYGIKMSVYSVFAAILSVETEFFLEVGIYVGYKCEEFNLWL